MKIDYNDTIGIGCDGTESPGEGLRQNMAATMDFLEEVKKEVPGIILENCASGGHRLEQGFMAATSIECERVLRRNMLCCDSVKVQTGSVGEYAALRVRIKEKYTSQVPCKCMEKTA